MKNKGIILSLFFTILLFSGWTNGYHETSRGIYTALTFDPSLCLGFPEGEFEEPSRPSIQRQNEMALLLACLGHEVKMLPIVQGGNGYGIQRNTSPDYLIDGDVYDCFTPYENVIKKILYFVNEKLRRQANKLVINLDESLVEIEDLVENFNRNKPDGLEEVYIIKNLRVMHIVYKY